jgi:hypothetical protein
LSHTSWGSDQKTFLQIHQIIVLSTLRYGEDAYGSASCAVRKHVKIYTDGSKMVDKVGYVIVKKEHTIRKRILPQNTVYSAEQSAIGAIQSEKNNRNKIVIITDSLNTIMAAESRTPTKNQDAG